MSLVFVLDTSERPLTPCPPAQARRLLTRGKASVFRHYPFTVILKTAVPDAQPAPLRLKLDPGSKATGVALLDEEHGQVVFAAEIAHRGQQVAKDLRARRAVRRGRRHRHTRYRQARFLNRRRRAGWLPPSLESRIANVLTWTERLMRLAPVAAISQELVRFDMQLMQTPDISGVEYQQGTLFGYEVRQYLLEKWGRRCAYCHAKDVPLQIEHLTPRARGGSNRVSNLTLACESCNVKKGTQTAAEFGHPALQAQARMPLKDAAAVNASRWALWMRLAALGLPLEAGTGGRTKWNRTQRNLPKAHWSDAACVGASTPELLLVDGVRVLAITAQGHGNRQMAQIDGIGFPRLNKAGKQQIRSRLKRHFGFMTGDIVRAVVPPGTKASGRHTGRIAVRASGGFRVGQVDDIRWKHCRLLQRHDGYEYALAGARQTGPRKR